MTDLPLVSIVTPTYNQEGFLCETIESVLSQDYARIDYCVVNDGSTDGTETLLRSFSGRLRWETQQNQGQTAAINHAWSAARGDILTWLNSDDTLLAGAVRTAVDWLGGNPNVGVLYGQSIFTDAAGRALPLAPAGRPFDYRELVRSCENPIPQPSAFIRRRVYEDLGPLDPSLYYFMDWDYWLRAGLRHGFGYVPRPLSTYRLHDQSKTVSAEARVAPELERIYRRYFDSNGLPSEISRLRNEALANVHFTMAGYYLRGGLPTSARRAALRAVTLNPRVLLSTNGWRKALYGCFGATQIYRALRSARAGRAA